MVLYTHNTNTPFTVDENKLKDIEDYNWRLERNGHIVATSHKTIKPLPQRKYLKDLILIPEPNTTTYHINGDKTDNRLGNLANKPRKDYKKVEMLWDGSSLYDPTPKKWWE